MLKLLLLSLLFVSSLLANKVIYLSYEKVPERVIKGEVFTVTLKSLSTVREFDDIRYELSNAEGIEILQYAPSRSIKGKFFYEKFYYRVKSNHARLPDVEARLITDKRPPQEDQNLSFEYPTTTLLGQKLNVITLNPKKEFSNIIADNFELQEFKTTSYDNKHNIIVFVATGKNTNITDLHFNNVYKQGIESSKKSYFNSKITYYVVIDKRLEDFSFTYFNLLKNRYQKINIPVIVDDDSVVAQSDLKPKDQSKEQLKMMIVAAVTLILFILIIWSKKYLYSLLLLLPLAYIAYLALPEKEVCIKAGADIHLLPVNNGTIFETTKSQSLFTKEGSVKNFIKVKLQNEKIGWVKNEDICSY